MAGCGGCDPTKDCNGPCSRRSETPRTSLTEALAQVIIDNRVVRAAVEYQRDFPFVTTEEIIVYVNELKSSGRLDDYA